MRNNKKIRKFDGLRLFPALQAWNHAKEILKLHDKSADDGRCNSNILAALSEPPKDLDCSLDRQRIESRWLEEVRQLGHERASLMRVIMKTLAPDLMKQILLHFVIRLIPIFIMLETMYSLLTYLEESDLKEAQQLHSKLSIEGDQMRDEVETVSETMVTLFGLVEIDSTILQYLCIISISITIRIASFLCLTFGGKRIGLKCRVILTNLIQMKSLRLNLYDEATRSNSKAIELITSEITLIEEASIYLIFAFTGPICLVSSLVWISPRVIDWRASLSIVPLVVVFLVLKCHLLKIRKRVNSNRRVETNKRIEATGVFLSSIKVIKMYAWERPFRNRIQSFRESELKYATILDSLFVIDLAIFIGSGILLPSLSLIVDIYCKANFTIQTLFLVPLCFQCLSVEYILQLSRAIQSLQDISSSCANIKQYLLLGEKKDPRWFNILDGRFDTIYRYQHVSSKQQPENHMIVYDSLCVSNEPTERILSSKKKSGGPTLGKTPKTSNLIIRNLTGKLKSDELVIVIGRVGSGKSTLLRTLLGETRIMAGAVQLRKGCKLSYASQDPWIISDSFRGNILFGRPIDLDRYKTVIEACSLRQDIERLAEGDETLIGPRGVSLSGGQKSRLGLARAIYADADVYLLDDPLSAVDARVAQDIFKKCIKQLLRNKLVLLATHQLQFLNQADEIIYLELNRQATFGSVEEILERESIKQFVATSSSQACESDCESSIASYRNESLSKELKVAGRSRPLTIARGESKIIERKESSNYIFFLKLGFSLVSFGFFIFNASLSGPLLACVTYYYRQWSRKAFEDIHNPNVDQNEFFDHLFQSWIKQTIIVALALGHLLVYATHLARGIRNCSRELHNKLITSLFQAKMSFYDFCCAGEFTSRYAGSFALIDHLLLNSSVYFISYSIWIVGSCFMLGLINLYGFVHFMALYLIILPTTLCCSKRLSVLNSLSRSLLAPTLTNLMDMVEDLSTIRSDKSYLEYFERIFNTSQNKFTSMTLLKLSYETWSFLAVKLVTGFAAFVLLIVMFSVFKEEMDVSTAGCFLLLLQFITSLFPIANDYGSIMETAMGGVEKVRQYTKLEAEPSPEGSMVTEKPVNEIRWPEGSIKFDSVTLRYFAKDRPVLDRLSFIIAGGEHVGVVGRTGAGKSSIMSVLFRLYAYDGVISIDGLDIGSVSLEALRASLGVIPQDPVLFCDTLRNNLDPFGQYSDEQIWRALEVVNLSNHVAKNLNAGLNHQINEGGRNFSVGQRQLVCLARAILKAPKILLIDEATANVDLETDSIVQLLIRKQFADSTVITIAHRLETVLDYDRVMVLDYGHIVEFDTVERLKTNEGGFNQMLKASNII